MRYIIAIFLLSPLYLIAQECKVKKITDPYTKEVRLTSGPIQFDGAKLSVDADSKEIDFFFSMDGKEKCFSDASTLVVLYEGTKVKGNFKNAGPVNCDGNFHLIFKNLAGNQALLQRLITQKIITFQFTGSNKSSQITVNLSPEEQQLFMTKADCVIKEAKTLIK